MIRAEAIQVHPAGFGGWSEAKGQGTGGQGPHSPLPPPCLFYVTICALLIQIYHSHFIVKETKIQGGAVTHLEGQELNPGFLTPAMWSGVLWEALSGGSPSLVPRFRGLCVLLIAQHGKRLQPRIFVI